MPTLHVRRASLIVVLKVSRSEHTAQVAQAHTGALVGDDRVFDAFCKQYGLIRVNSLDELVHTADIFLKAGPIAGKRIAAISISGGLSEICADLATISGLELWLTSHTQTVKELREFLPDYAGANCPLDLTGLSTTMPEMAGRAITAICEGPGCRYRHLRVRGAGRGSRRGAFSEPMLGVRRGGSQDGREAGRGDVASGRRTFPNMASG